MTTRLNFFRLALQFLLRCLEWVPLPTTRTCLWNWPKNAKTDNLLKTKIILKPKYKSSCGSLFTFNPCQRGETYPSPSVNDATATNALNRKWHLSCLNLQKVTSIRLKLMPSNAGKSCVSNFKIADYFVKLRGTMFSAMWCILACLQAQHRIV